LEAILWDILQKKNESGEDHSAFESPLKIRIYFQIESLYHCGGNGEGKAD
jgi:hypothetical protein